MHFCAFPFSFLFFLFSFFSLGGLVRALGAELPHRRPGVGWDISLQFKRMSMSLQSESESSVSERISNTSSRLKGANM